MSLIERLFKYQYIITMDIDITDAAFSLATTNIASDITNDIISNSDLSDNTTYMYVGIFILISLVGFFVYKYYQTNKKRSNEIDCEGGFSSMDQVYRNDINNDEVINDEINYRKINHSQI